MKSPEQKPKLNIKKATPRSLAEADKIFQELREAHWKNKAMIDREMLTQYPEVLDKRLDKYDGYLKDLVKINYPADEIDQVKQGLIDIKKLRQEYELVWGSDKQDMDEAKKIKKQVNTKLAEMKALEQMVNFEKSKENWLGFYKKYNIDASSLANIKLTKAGMETQREIAEKYGFDKIVMIPAGVSPESLIDNDSFAVFKDKEAKDDQNTGTNGTIKINDNIDKSDYWKKETEKPQVIFLKNKPGVDSDENETMKELKKADETKTKDEKILKKGDTTRYYKYPEIIKMEKELGLEGLDFVSAMILDRQYFDENKCHLWDWKKKNATWLTKDLVKGISVRLFWDPDDRQWDVNLLGETVCGGNLGSVFTCSLEIEEKK